MRQVHIPRWSQLMRSARMPYLQKPHVTPIQPLTYPGITPWHMASAPQPAGALGVYEVAAVEEPRANPAFSDAYVIGATGAANMVVPQGIDYSRRPCCAGGGNSALGSISDTLSRVPPWAWLGAAAVATFFGVKAVAGLMSKKHGTRNPGSAFAKMHQKAEAYISRMGIDDSIDPDGLDRAVWPDYRDPDWMSLGVYEAQSILEKHVRAGDMVKDGKWYVKKPTRPFDRNPWRGAERRRLNERAEIYISELHPGETIDATMLDAAVWPEHDDYGEMRLGHYDASILLSKAERQGTLKRVGFASPAKSKFVKQNPRRHRNTKWTRAYVNNLPDSAFLYIERGGWKDEHGKTAPRKLRHFPVKDHAGRLSTAHLKNALSRIPQSTAKGLTRKKVRELKMRAGAMYYGRARNSNAVRLSVRRRDGYWEVGYKSAGHWVSLHTAPTKWSAQTFLAQAEQYIFSGTTPEEAVRLTRDRGAAPKLP